MIANPCLCVALPLLGGASIGLTKRSIKRSVKKPAIASRSLAASRLRYCDLLVEDERSGSFRMPISMFHFFVGADLPWPFSVCGKLAETTELRKSRLERIWPCGQHHSF